MSSQGVTQSRSNTDRIIAASLLAERNLIEGKNAYDGDSPFTGLSTGGRNIVSPTGNFLSKSGDVRLGPMGDEHTFQPILNGIIDVSTNERYNFPWIFLTPEDGINDDDLETIIQGADVRPNQILYIQTGTANVTITVKNTGNIMTLNNEDVLLSFGLVAELRYSQLLGVWVMMNVNTGGGGSEEENRIFQGNSSVTVNDSVIGGAGVINFAIDGTPIGSFTERFGLLLQTDLNMAGNDILGVGDIGFNQPLQSIISREDGLNYVVNERTAHDFFVHTIIKFEIGDSVILHTTLDLSDHNLLLNNSSRIQGELIPDVAFRNFGGVEDFWGSMFGGKLYIKTEDVNIDTLNQEMIFNVPDEWGYEWRINGIQAISIREDGSLDISNENLQRVKDIEFMNDGQKIQSTSTSLIYDVPEDEFHTFIVDNVVKLTIGTSAISVSDDIQMNDNDIDFGSGILKFSVNRGEIQGGLDSEGSIRVMIGDTIFKIPYFR